MKILVAPLDWGLGHATRCVPVIREFIRQGAEVELAVVRANASLLREIFPELRQRLAPSYNIVYPKHGYNMGLWLLKNSSHMNAVMRYERRYADEMVARHGYDVLLSDNRFGFYSKNAYNIYMTHQRRIAFPKAFSAFERVGEIWHGKIMSRFDQVWVPDLEEAPGYAGNLSHVADRSRKARFVGALSRFDIPETCGSSVGVKEYKVVAVISGVEPARSQFENQLREALRKIPGKHMMILGRPSATQKCWTEGNIVFHNHLPTEPFAAAVRDAEWVVSRGGYSTVMDMAVLGAKCIFVPTPGQYEQVVLGRNLSAAGFAACIPSKELCAESLQKAFRTQVALPPPPAQNLLSSAVENVFKEVKDLKISHKG